MLLQTLTQCSRLAPPTRTTPLLSPPSCMTEDSAPPESAETQEPPVREAITKETLDLKAVARVSTKTRLTGLRIHDCSAELNVEPESLPDDWRDRIFNGYDSSVTGIDTGRRVVKIRCAFVCAYMEGLDLRVDKLPPYERDNPPTFAVDAGFDLTYALRGDEEVDEGDLAHFAFANGTHNAWPYWRELVQNFTQRMGIDPVVVGPFKLPSPHDPKRAEPEAKPALDEVADE
jgi:hypothetical protein